MDRHEAQREIWCSCLDRRDRWPLLAPRFEPLHNCFGHGRGEAGERCLSDACFCARPSTSAGEAAQRSALLQKPPGDRGKVVSGPYSSTEGGTAGSFLGSCAFRESSRSDLVSALSGHWPAITPLFF